MQNNFEPNKTKPIDYQNVFREHICKTLNKPHEWSRVEPTFVQMDRIRDSFDWKTLTQSEHFNQPIMRTLQDSIEEYLRLCIFLSKRFVFGGKSAETVKSFKSDWLMAWSKDKVQSSSIVFEICNFLFNYIILNFNQAVMFLKDKQGVDQYKNSLQKLQYAVWACHELLQYNQSLQNSIKVPFEFQQGTLEFLNSLITGLAYMCLLNIILESAKDKVKVKGDDMASLEAEISRNFSVVRASIKTNSKLKNHFGYLFENVTFKYFEHRINALIKMAEVFESKHNEAKTKGYIGFQISFLTEALIVFKEMDKENFSDKKILQKEFNGLSKKIEELTLINNEVYKAPIPKDLERIHIKPIEQKVRPIEPKNVRIPPDDSRFFESFRCEEMDTIRSSLGLFTTSKKQHIEKTLFDLKEKYREICTLYNIQFLMSCGSLGESVCNDQFMKKIWLIRDKGEKGYSDLVAGVQNNKKAINDTIGKIDKLVGKETENDNRVLHEVQNGQYTTFVQAFNDQLKNVDNLKANITGYRTMEEKIIKLYENSKTQLPQLVNKSVDPKSLVKGPDIEEFSTKNAEALGQLRKLYTGVDLLINTHLTNDANEILHVLNDLDIGLCSQKIAMNEKTTNSIYEEINVKLGPMTLAFEEKVSKVMGPLEKLKDLSQKLVTANPKVTQNHLNQILLAVDFFYDSYPRLDNIKCFYEMTLLELKRIQYILEDGAVARDINRDELLQEAKNRQTRYEQSNGNSSNNNMN